MRQHPSIVIAAVVVVVLALLLALGRSYSTRQLHAKCYFQDAQGLRPGAEVRLAGVRVGSVRSVRVRPELRDHRAEVEVLFNTSYDLKIPEDAVASLQTAGVLGEVFVDIDIQRATGGPLAEGGVLRTRENPTLPNLLECLSNIMEHKPCDLHGKTERATPGPSANPASK